MGGELIASEDMHGYAEYRFTVENHSPTTSHRVSLTIPRAGDVYTNKLYLRSISRSVDVGPNAKVPVSLFQPNLRFSPVRRGSLHVDFDGRTAREDFFFVPFPLRGSQTARDHTAGSGLFSRSILTSPLITQQIDANAHKSTFDQPARPVPMGNPFPTKHVNYRNKWYQFIDVYMFHAALVSTWSEHWLCYSGYDGLVLRAADLQAIGPDATAALRQYVECGGSLLIIGALAAPKAWEKTRTKIDTLTGYYPGFGQCLVIEETNIPKWEAEQWKPIATMWERSARPWQDIVTPSVAHRRFPVVENIGIPIRTLFVMMLVFSLAIGPVNIFVLIRSRRRFWLLWTVPLVSLLTCATVVAFMTLSEGWQGHARMEGMTILDENAQRATSVGWLGLYAPMTPEGGLHFHPDMELTPHLGPERRLPPAGSPRTVVWTDDQNLRSGWLTARVPAHFLVRSSEHREERLLVSKETDGSLSVVNALGAPIASVWVADSAGKIYTASALPVDGKATLTATTQQAAGTAERLRQAYGEGWLRLVDFVANAPEQYLRPGCYIAVLDSAPFFQTGLRSAELRPSRSVVLGIMKEP
jgi:hypothetical protein